jgi:hypothetical protein
MSGGVNAYHMLWQAYQNAIEIPDPISIELTRHAVSGTLRLSAPAGGMQSFNEQGFNGTGRISRRRR